jgi:hypothetical protein
MHENFITRLNTVAFIFFFLLLFLMVLNTFFRHITPDISVFLLHTRTFLEEGGGRFIFSFDNKGPLMTFLLAPAVWLFGAKMAAAAFTQAILYTMAIVFFVFALKNFYGAMPSLIVAMLIATLSYSGWLWGGNLRPEDLMPLLFGMMFFFNTRKPFSRAAYFVNGLSVATAFFLKLSLVLAPAAVLCTVAIFDFLKTSRASAIFKAFLWTSYGVLALAIPIMLYLILFDDVSGWFRQALVLPLESRMGSATSFKMGSLIELIYATGFIYPLSGALIYFLFLLSFKSVEASISVNVVALPAIWLLAELSRVFIEGAPWPYLLIGVVPASLIAISFGACSVPLPYKRIAGWFFPAVFLLPLMSDAYATEIKAFNLRVLEKGKAPYEELAVRMKATYQSGETIFVEDTDYQLFLLLKAPAPYPVLKRLFWFVRDAERKNFLAFYATNPPDWIVVRRPQNSPVGFCVEGDVDCPYHIWRYGKTCDNNSKKLLMREGMELPARTITQFVPSLKTYKLLYDIGWAQAWKRQ